MKLAAPFIQLPLHVDAARLEAEVARLGEAPWRPHPQGFAGNSMLPLVSVGGDPANEAFEGIMAPTPALRACPYMLQVFASLRATVGRSRLMRLSGQAEVTRHVDQGYYWAERVRVHVPIVTQPTVRFECGGDAINMAAGECWIFDTWRQHRVINDANQDRIHLVVDTVGGGRFWDLVAAGRPVGQVVHGWASQLVAPSAAMPTILCERVNVPTVMSPWEMAGYFQLLFEDTVTHPALARLKVAVGRFINTWRGLWFAHGDSIGARPHYQPALRAFVVEARPLAHGVVLTNEISWYSAMLTLIARYAAGDLRSAGAPAG
ncbi:aspartyl/asparaginyl beta-hydroxylase domain-containing protein [Cognatilysobacter lacus]|uniref:Aspartyl/asparaginyl beta-hydroxylase domain-containing protein n=1 Tax=Cognatilysobacter lacus TaxID=1643323 RepID=A0A5D8ZA24_9GAMM|nr:aspartyl/asparaginyl beta-hydroxylase domain-containing protein [Lysobacter lacus]TZF90913.1 aspartyl/asparaginyl beta-hydroxylase domain-containing protein [Lysobacter lacus]